SPWGRAGPWVLGWPAGPMRSAGRAVQGGGLIGLGHGSIRHGGRIGEHARPEQHGEDDKGQEHQGGDDRSLHGPGAYRSRQPRGSKCGAGWPRSSATARLTSHSTRHSVRSTLALTVPSLTRWAPKAAAWTTTAR